MIVLLTAVVILAAVGLIIVLRVDPVISLVAGSLFLGLASGLGFEKTLMRHYRAKPRQAPSNSRR